MSKHQNNFIIENSTTKNVIDVSGAGDTVVSVAAICMACNIDFKEIALLANIAGGIVCEKVGVVPITNQELLESKKKFLMSKIVKPYNNNSQNKKNQVKQMFNKIAGQYDFEPFSNIWH